MQLLSIVYYVWARCYDKTVKHEYSTYDFEWRDVILDIKWCINDVATRYILTDNYDNNTDLDWKFYTTVGRGIERFCRILSVFA